MFFLTLNTINNSTNVPLNLSGLPFDHTIFEQIEPIDYDYFFAEYATLPNETAPHPKQLTIEKLQKSISDMNEYCGSLSNYRIKCPVDTSHLNKPLLKHCNSIFHPQCRTEYLSKQAGKMAFRVNLGDRRLPDSMKIFHLEYRNPNISENEFRNQITAVLRQWAVENYPENPLKKFVLGIIVIRHEFNENNPLEPDIHYHALVSPLFYQESKNLPKGFKKKDVCYLLKEAGNYDSFLQYLPAHLDGLDVSIINTNNAVELKNFIFGLLKKPLDLMDSIRISQDKQFIEYIIGEHTFVVPIREFAKILLYYRSYEKTARYYGMFSDKMYLVYRQRFFERLDLHPNRQKNTKLRPYVRELVAVIDEHHPLAIRKLRPQECIDGNWRLNPINERFLRKKIREILNSYFCPICGARSIKERDPDPPT